MIIVSELKEMNEMEFDSFEKQVEEEVCNHKTIVKLIYCGMHSNYGCVSCKKKTLDLKEFDLKME